MKIDRLISELQGIRTLLHNEGERVRREITGYAGLSQSAVATMKVIGDTLSQLKPGSIIACRRATISPDLCDGPVACTRLRAAGNVGQIR